MNGVRGFMNGVRGFMRKCQGRQFILAKLLFPGMNTKGFHLHLNLKAFRTLVLSPLLSIDSVYTAVISVAVNVCGGLSY